MLTPRVGDDFVSWESHLDNPDLPSNTLAAAERWAAGLGNLAYAIDDETAIRVVDGNVEVVSEGSWKLL